MRCLGSPRLVLAGLLAALAAAPATASAAAGCPAVATAQPYLWAGDAAWYFTAPGGDFARPDAGWALSGPAAITAAQRGPRDGDGVLALGGRGSATSPPVCVDGARPHLRFDVRSVGRRGRLRVEALRPGRPPVVLATLPAARGAAWGLSPTVPLAGALGVTGRATQTVSLRLTALGGAWSVDDVAIDPYRR